MSDQRHKSASNTRFLNRFHARLATLSRPATAFTSTPEPRTIGSFARGRQIVGGNFLFAGFLVEARGSSIWELPMPDAAFEEALHGFTWLDDLGAVGDVHANKRAQEWTHEWVASFGKGVGPGWTPDLTGRRLIRWINHAILLLNGQPKEVSEAYFRSLATQTIFLSRRWKAASPGLPRFEALTGLIYAGLALDGMDGHVARATQAMTAECGREIDPSGALVTRNPEELLEVFTLLTWAAAALQDAGRMPGEQHLAAIKAVAPVLRALRHSDGGLARFHGGGRGLEGRLDRALASAGVKPAPMTELAMGFSRVSHGRTSLIVDAAAPPVGPASANAHASTSSFEVTSGRRPLVVNCGSGATFGKSWRRAGRATPSHSTLGLDGFSSSRVATKNGVETGAELLKDTPTDVRFERSDVDGGTRVVVGHNGYDASHGLTHVRTVHLGYDGRSLRGEDALVALDKPARRRFDMALDRSKLRGVEFSVRFHLHPDVDVTLDMNGTAVSMALKSGEIWIFRPQGEAQMTLESSVYLEKTRLSPRATKQIVLSGHAIEYSTRVVWSLAKAQETPTAVRDYETEDLVTVD